jgi:hypothetical protein
VRFSIVFFLLIFANLYTSEKEFILITSLYHESRPSRQHEFITCLEHNIANDLIEKIEIFFDQTNGRNEEIFFKNINSKKINITYIAGRPSYQSCIDFANRTYPNRKVIVANGDIFFDETLGKLSDLYLNKNVIVLSRWNVTSTGDSILEGLPLYKNFMTFDASIFNTPISLCSRQDISLGSWQSDSAIALLLQSSGYTLLNPCYDVHAYHVHKSQIRDYAKVKLMRDEEVPDISWKRIEDFYKKNSNDDYLAIIDSIKKTGFLRYVISDDEVAYLSLQDQETIHDLSGTYENKKIIILKSKGYIDYEQVYTKMYSLGMYCFKCLRNDNHLYFIFIKGS